MNGWAKAALALAAFLLGGWRLGWQGVVFAMVGVVVWLAWEMLRLSRLMKLAGSAPVGRVGDASALHARLRDGMKLDALVAAAGSLGQRLPGPTKAYGWQDALGHRVEVELANGRVTRSRLLPPAADAPAP